jgi:hypothetical protein
MTTAAARHAGSCLCGGVRFVATAPLRAVLACHCRECRKQSGHFVAMTSVPLDRFELLAGDSLAWYRASAAAERGFCRACGSTLFWKPADEPRISIAAGAFDGPIGVTVERHIHCAEKGDYYEIADGLPQLPGGR